MSKPCPLCASAGATRFAAWPDFVVLECRACGFRYVDPSDPRYPRDAQRASDTGALGEVRPGLPHIRRRVRDILRYRHPPGRALDVGCGRGELALALREQGFECTGIDLKAAAIAQLQSRFPQVEWRCATVEELSGAAGKPEGRYDVLALYHVLEHLSDPRAVLAALKALANPGALIAIEVPNAGGWEARMKGDRWHYYKADHLGYFRVRHLRGLAAELGLAVLSVRGYQHFSHPQDVVWKDAVKATLGWLGFQDVVSVFLQVPLQGGHANGA